MYTLPVEVTTERIPGAAPVSEHSLFTAIADAQPVTIAEERDDDTTDVLRQVVHTERVPLDGEWLRHAYEEEPTVQPFGRDFDDSAWEHVFVPNNFGLEPALSAHFGPVYYRRRLATLDSPHTLLLFEAVDYLADVWLDDEHLGHHEGYFAPFCFNVSDKVQGGSILTVRVQAPFEDLADDEPIFAHAKKTIKGTLNYHDSRPGGLPGSSLTPGWTARLGQSLTTGGITGGVSLYGSGPVRLDALFATPLDVEAGIVHIAAVFTNVTSDPIVGNFKLAIALPEQEAATATLPVTFAVGANRLDVRVTLSDPVLWWPVSHADLGQPALYSMTATVMLENVLSDTRATTFGMRTAHVTGDTKRLEINGRPVFVQAANYIPRQHFADVDVEFYRRDMKLAADAHLNSFGVHGHIQAPPCYDAADQEGILLFQDFALQWRYDSGTETNPGFIEKACRQIVEMAYTYWNHPSIVYWACHNEPMAMFFPGQPADPATDTDNQVLDEALETRLREVETHRHIHRASGIGDDLHMYDGSLNGITVYNVRTHRSWFVSEYGFWTLGPRIDKWNDQGWPPDEFQMHQWLSRLSFGPSTMNFTGLPERYTTRDAWQQVTELYGAFLAKYQTEWFRIHRGDPFYAYRWHFFVDWWGWAGGGLVDVERKPKATYTALQAASRKLLVATSQPNTLFAPGTELQFPIHAINEQRETVPLNVFWRWSRISSSIVIGADTEVTQRFNVLASASENAMSAIPHPQHSGDVLASGSIIGEVGPETTTLLDTLTLKLPDDELVSVTLDLFWGDGETNSFHILTAQEDWFCGPGAFVISEGKPKRFEGIEE